MHSCLELVAAYERRDLSPVEVTLDALARIERVDPRLNAFVTVTGELALEQAEAAERAYASGTAGALAGIPLSIKDLVDVAGVRCTRGSLVWADHIAAEDAPLVENVRAAGGVILGKTNTPEHGWKGETTNLVTGSTHNPWRHGLTPGGSSGGAAAAVAAGLGVVAQGGDGAGSIRIPASMCGVVGFKPTHDVVPSPSRSGLAVQGPLARSVADAALLLDVVAGRPVAEGLGAGIAGARVAWSADVGYAAVEPGVAAIAEAAVARFSELGCSVEPVHPGLPDPWPVVDVIWAYNQADGEDEHTLEVADPGRRVVAARGARLTPSDHASAQAAGSAYRARMDEFMSRHDLLVTPTLPCTAFEVGLDQPGSVAGLRTEYLSWTALTYPFNVAGMPAVSVPCGRLDGLPVGLQIAGGRGRDALVLRAAAAFEAVAAWAYDDLDLV